MRDTITIDDVTIHLASQDTFEAQWVGFEELMDELLASWHLVTEEDLPLNPRIIGRPGVGKTTLAYAAARKLGKEVYMFQATMDTRPEDLIISPVVASNQSITYVASPLVTAMIRGGVCVLDEGNRMSEKSWASLAPLLDRRRYVESVVAGVKIEAHPEFRFCVTMNDDASTYEVPEYIHSRLRPQIELGFPGPEDERKILEYNVPFSKEELVDYTVQFLIRAHDRGEPYTVRDGVSILQYANKLSSLREDPIEDIFDLALVRVLGREAMVDDPGEIDDLHWLS